MLRTLSKTLLAAAAAAVTLTSMPSESFAQGLLRERLQERREVRRAQIRERIQERVAGRKAEIRERIAERRAAATPRRQGDGTPDPVLDRVTLTHGGRERSYFVEPGTMGQGRPAIMIFHGGMGDGTRAAKPAKIAALAAARGFAVIYPNSDGTQWNDGRATTRSGIDDVGFVRAIAADAGARYGIDTSRLFAAGISNGGMFAMRLACEASDLFDGYGVIVANMPADLAPGCTPGAAQPMIFFNGTKDRLMPFEGGEILSSRSRGAGGTVLSHAQTVEFWRAANGCGAPDPGGFDRVTDGTRVETIRYDCAGNADLFFYVISGGGHNWPGSDIGGSRLSGTVTKEVSATEAMVEFFGRYGL